MTRLWLVSLFVACTAGAAFAQSAAPAIHIAPTGDGFETYLAAAMAKKNVPARVVENADRATLTLKASQIEVKKDTTGTKVMKCLFQSCEGINDTATTSVKLVDRQGTVVWSYAVNKERGGKNRQSMAEAIAKHLKSEYFRR